MHRAPCNFSRVPYDSTYQEDDPKCRPESWVYIDSDLADRNLCRPSTPRAFAGSLAVDLVLDVGGNAGQFRDVLRNQLDYTGHIVTFEPVPHLARELMDRAARDPFWDVQQRALGATSGTMTFNIMVNTEFSSFLAPIHSDVDMFVKDNVIAESVPVEVTTLDEVLPSLIERLKTKSTYLKIDAQGFELEILKGGNKTLSCIAALQSEVAFRKIYDGAADFKAIIDHVATQGFVVSGMFKNNDGHFPFTVDFDFYFIRQDFKDGGQSS